MVNNALSKKRRILRRVRYILIIVIICLSTFEIPRLLDYVADDIFHICEGDLITDESPDIPDDFPKARSTIDTIFTSIPSDKKVIALMDSNHMSSNIRHFALSDEAIERYQRLQVQKIYLEYFPEYDQHFKRFLNEDITAEELYKKAPFDFVGKKDALENHIYIANQLKKMAQNGVEVIFISNMDDLPLIKTALVSHYGYGLAFLMEKECGNIKEPTKNTELYYKLSRNWQSLIYPLIIDEVIAARIDDTKLAQKIINGNQKEGRSIVFYGSGHFTNYPKSTASLLEDLGLYKILSNPL